MANDVYSNLEEKRGLTSVTSASTSKTGKIRANETKEIRRKKTIKIKAEISEIENRKTIASISETKMKLISISSDDKETRPKLPISG